MNRIFICRLNKTLLNRLKNRQLVITTKEINEVDHIFKSINETPNKLHCIIVRSEKSLSDIDFNQKLGTIPIALYVANFGDFKKTMSSIPLMKQSNIRIYFPADHNFNYTACMILSSLGIASTIVFNNTMKPDWEMLADLMTYAVLGKVPHAPIEPFNHITAVYRPENRTDFNSIYFDDPKKYLYLDGDARVALSKQDLIAHRFIADDIEQLDSIEDNPLYIQHTEAWRNFFVRMTPCSCCQGWRICLGKFSEQAEDGRCSAFFTELMDVVEQYQNENKKKNPLLWQP